MLKCWKNDLGERHKLGAVLFVGILLQVMQRGIMAVEVVSHAGMAEEFGWTSAEKGLVLSSFFYGYGLPQILVGWASSRVGGRLVYFITFVPAVLSILTPIVAPHGITPVIVIRFLFGVGQSVIWPTAVGLIALWAPPSERTTFYGFVNSSFAFGYFLSTWLTSLMISAFGWRCAFLLYGGLNFFWLGLWYRFGWSRPGDNPRITIAEFEQIQGPILAKPTPLDYVPWSKLFNHRAVWGELVADGVFGSCAISIFITFVPTYLHQELGLHLSSAGFYASLPQLASLVLQLIFAPYVDKMIRRGGDLTRIRKLFTLVPAAIQSIASGCLILKPGVQVSVVLFIIILGMLGPMGSGTHLIRVDMTQDYASVLESVGNTFSTLCTGLWISLIGVLFDRGHCSASNDLGTSVVISCDGSWSLAFALASVMFVSQGVLYGFFASSEPLRLGSSDDARECELRNLR